jgi:alcohol dehydrogenase class IV
VAPYLDADMCVLDAQLTVGLPASLTAATGMDAMTHALEGLASPVANLFSDAHCMMSAQAIERFLPRVVADGQDQEARSQMLAAACMAVNGYLAAFNATPVHNFAHAFGAMYHIPHGDANAALLPIVMESLVDFYAPNAERLARALNMPDTGSSGVDRVHEVIARIRALQQEIGCATDFKRWQVTAQDMEQIIMAVSTDPVAIMYPLTPEKIQEIALKVIG